MGSKMGTAPNVTWGVCFREIFHLHRKEFGMESVKKKKKLSCHLLGRYFSLWPHHLEHSCSHFISATEQAQAWLVLEWEEDILRKV